MIFELKPGKILRVVLAIICLLFVANMAAILAAFMFGPDSLFARILLRVFSVDGEMNLPTWYASITLFICSLLLSIITLVLRKKKDKYYIHWGGLSLIFTYLSLDEASGIHELLVKPVKLLHLHGNGIFYFSWLIVGIPIALILAIMYMNFLIKLPGKIRILFLVSGMVFVSGVLGMEMIGGWYASIHGTDNLMYMLLTTLEETLEMLGIAVFIYALLTSIHLYGEEIVFRVTSN